MNAKTKRLIVGLAILVVILGGTTTYFFYRNHTLIGNNGSAETKTLVSKVDKLIILPEGEVPTVATVSDLAALKDQVFFVDAKVGDKVLIYSNAKKAVLYNPEVNKIVNVAPLNIGSDKAAPVSVDTNTSSGKENEF